MQISETFILHIMMKKSAQWVPRQLTQIHWNNRMAIATAS